MLCLSVSPSVRSVPSLFTLAKNKTKKPQQNDTEYNFILNFKPKHKSYYKTKPT